MALLSLPFLILISTSLLLFHAGRSSAWRRLILGATSTIFFLSFATGGVVALPSARGLWSLSVLIGFALLGFIGTHISRARPVYAPAMAVGFVVLFSLCRYCVPAWNAQGTVYVIVGLSYILFRILHIILDVSSDALSPLPTFCSYLGYIFFFPTFFAGPIWRYEEYVPDLGKPSDCLTTNIVLPAFSRISTGMLKVLALANISLALHHSCERILQTGVNARFLGAMGAYYALAALLYLAYFYYDFSGYMDIVVGIGRLYNLNLPENFNYPFESLDILDFWNRWHITLSQWMRRYVFTPLVAALTRWLFGTRWADYIGPAGYFIVFLLIGVWHGSTWPFVCFGVFLGLAASLTKSLENWGVHRLGRKRYHALREHMLARVLMQCITVFLVAAGLSFLWVDPSLWGSFGFTDLIGLLFVGTIAAYGFVISSAGCRNLAGFMTRAATMESGGISTRTLFNRGVVQAWLAIKVFMVIGILVSQTDNVPVFIYQGF